MSETIQRARELYLGRRVQITGGRNAEAVSIVVGVRPIPDNPEGINVETADGKIYRIDRVTEMTPAQLAGVVGGFGLFTRTVRVLPQPAAVYRAQAAEVGGCRACGAQPEQVNVIGTGGVAGQAQVTALTLCDDCAELLEVGLMLARQLRAK